MLLLNKFRPPTKWMYPVIIMLGFLTGIACYSFYVSKSWSYLSNDPSTCVNCHVMTPQYATWAHSAHYNQANCNDCHVPQDNFFKTYFFKAKDGLRHATMFTLRMEPQVIRIKEEGQQAVLDNCIRCHGGLVEDMVHKPLTRDGEMRKCWECHRETPHGRTSSLSSAPNARVPLPPSPVPDWLKGFINGTEKESPKTP